MDLGHTELLAFVVQERRGETNKFAFRVKVQLALESTRPDDCGAEIGLS